MLRSRSSTYFGSPRICMSICLKNCFWTNFLAFCCMSRKELLDLQSWYSLHWEKKFSKDLVLALSTSRGYSGKNFQRKQIYTTLVVSFLHFSENMMKKFESSMLVKMFWLRPSLQITGCDFDHNMFSYHI